MENSSSPPVQETLFLSAASSRSAKRVRDALTGYPRFAESVGGYSSDLLGETPSAEALLNQALEEFNVNEQTEAAGLGLSEGKVASGESLRTTSRHIGEVAQGSQTAAVQGKKAAKWKLPRPPEHESGLTHIKEWS